MNKVSSPVNIDSRGYGRIYKAVMRNRQLPLLAKTIYAYFCSYAGNGYQAYPKREKIVRDLKMNKNTYAKHLNTLISKGYIAKERTLRRSAPRPATCIQSCERFQATRGPSRPGAT